MLFSATFPGRLREAAESWVKDAVIVRCSAMEFADHSKLAQLEQQQVRPTWDSTGDYEAVEGDFGEACVVLALVWVDG